MRSAIRVLVLGLVLGLHPAVASAPVWQSVSFPNPKIALGWESLNLLLAFFCGLPARL